MISAWTKRVLLGCCLALPIACVVSVGEDDGDIDDGLGGASGGTSIAGSGGSSAGSSSGGASGSAGSAGSMSINNGGTGGSDIIDTPVCTEETEDDECTACIKQQCCTEWQACNTITCQDQSEDVIACVVDNMADPEVYNDMCIPLAADPEDFLAENSQALMTCINERVLEGDAGLETTRCGIPCFGLDLFMDD